MSEYTDYINSEAWRQKAEMVKAERGNHCELCWRSGEKWVLDVHHLTYERMGNEDDKDLQVLCRLCHARVHGKLPKLAQQMVYQILVENGITYTNDDPWWNYSKGKAILWNYCNDDDWETFDEYNKINIRIVGAACVNQERREFQRMKENDWGAYETEYQYRISTDYWEGWHED